MKGKERNRRERNAPLIKGRVLRGKDNSGSWGVGWVSLIKKYTIKGRKELR
jgi:hypothetical protein